MKKIAFFAIIMLSVFYLKAQRVLTQNSIIPDIAPYPVSHDNLRNTSDSWETIFHFPVSDISSGAETDGDYIYVSGWYIPDIRKFDEEGNLIEEFTLDGIDGVKDMAYDGQYFYGGNSDGTNKLFVMDFNNQVLVNSIQMPFKVRAIAYNHDLNVFYANDWSDDIKVFTADGTVLDTITLDTYGNYYGFAYDSWSDGGPYLWGFSHDGPSVATLVQLELPSGEETGFVMDLSYLELESRSYAGGLFTHPEGEGGRVIIGGVIQNNSVFGLELGTGIPVPEECYAPSNLHGSLVDSVNVELTWFPAKYNILNEHFNFIAFPPPGWTRESYGYGWWSEIPYWVNWAIPEWDSPYAAASNEEISNGCCDYLITPELLATNGVDYRLSFESYFDGANNQSAYIKYSLDDGSTWNLFHTMQPDASGWTYLDFDLSPIPYIPGEPFKIAFHADDNGGLGSGWLIDNVRVYSDDPGINVLGYEVYRDDVKVHTGLLNDTSFTDIMVPGGTHSYYVKTVYDECSVESGAIEFWVPHYPPPPPSPDCNPPQNLEARVVGQDIELEWNTPVVSFSRENMSLQQRTGLSYSGAGEGRFKNQSRGGWDVQFNYPLVMGDGEAGAESDGNYLYTSNRSGRGIYKYDLEGNYIKTIDIFVVTHAHNMAYVPSTGYTYLTHGTSYMEIVDLHAETFIDDMILPCNATAIAYNEDLDAFYVNNGSSDINLIDRQTGAIISSFICGSHGNYYDFAYDNWTAGGPYLWGFSQDEPGNTYIVQIKLPEGNETGYVYDASWLSSGDDGIAGGLFAIEGIVPGTVSLVGVVQEDKMFSLELGEPVWDFLLGGYNIYMNGSLQNTDLIQDTAYLVADPGAGTYSFEVSAVYVDSAGTVLCESSLEGPVEVSLTDVLLIGGNILAGPYKLDEGEIDLFRFEGGEIEENFTTEIDDIGYFLFPQMTPGYYLIHAKPDNTSAYSGTHVPTYFGGGLHWEDVATTYIEQNSYNMDVDLIEMKVPDQGTGGISGHVYSNDSKGDPPLQEVQVMLLNQEGNCISVDYTNTAGRFSFSNLAMGSYYLLVEIAGKSMDLLNIVLSDTEPVVEELTMIVNDNEVVLGVDEILPPFIDFISEIYPNPAGQRATLVINMNEAQRLNLKVYGVSGNLIREGAQELRVGSNHIDLELQNLKSGVYYINFIFDERYSMVKKLMVM